MNLKSGNRSAAVLTLNGAAAGDPRILVFGDAQELSGLADRITGKCFLAALSPLDWNDDLTPWPADNGRGHSWGGKLPELLPAVEEVFSSLPSGPSYTAGYSLGGLAALYTACVLELDGAASCSGSLWYPGVTEFFSSRPVPKHIYLSLGTKEKKPVIL